LQKTVDGAEGVTRGSSSLLVEVAGWLAAAFQSSSVALHHGLALAVPASVPSPRRLPLAPF